MADTDIDAIINQKRAEKNKQYQLKRKLEMQKQASTASENEISETELAKKHRKWEYNKQY
jgi:hypothetical protein